MATLRSVSHLRSTRKITVNCEDSSHIRCRFYPCLRVLAQNFFRPPKGISFFLGSSERVKLATWSLYLRCICTVDISFAGSVSLQRTISSMDEEPGIASEISISNVEGAGEFAGGTGRSRGGVGCADKLFQEPRSNIRRRNQSSMKNSGSSFVLQFVLLLLRQCQHVK